jgi:hypothetical protein
MKTTGDLVKEADACAARLASADKPEQYDADRLAEIWEKLRTAGLIHVPRRDVSELRDGTLRVHAPAGGAYVKRTIQWLWVLVSAVLLGGCTEALLPAAAAIHELPPERVGECQFLATVHGSSGWGGVLSSVGEEGAKIELVNQAARLQATDIVWVSVSGGMGGGEAMARAYRCPRVAAAPLGAGR